jgi:anthranilate phosphoribosyltransferase
VEEFVLDPAELGLPRAQAQDLRGDDPEFNASVVRRLLAGEQGPVRDAVLLNAGAALAVHAAEPGSVVERLQAGLARAAESIDSGKAQASLDRWVEASAAS